MTVGFAVILQEVGTEWLHAECADEVIRVELFAKGSHEGARNRAGAVSTNGDALLLQKVKFAVR